MSQRCIKISIANNTSVTWYRHMHGLGHGAWSTGPKEQIRPHSTIHCSAESTKSFGHYSGQVQYSVVLAGAEYVICATFEIPLLDNSRYNAWLFLANGTKLEVPSPNKLFSTDYTNTEKPTSKFSIGIWETPEGSQYIEKCSKQLEEYVRNATSSPSVFALHDEASKGQAVDRAALVASLVKNAPKHFVWNVKNIRWQEKLRKAHRSLFVRIVNLTPYELVRSSRCKVELALDEGCWDEFPSEAIPPCSFSEFGAHCDGIFMGTQGFVDYEVSSSTSAGKKRQQSHHRQQLPAARFSTGHFRFWWAQPAIGTFKCGYTHAASRFSVYRHFEALNEGVLVFHIIDPRNASPMKITTARAVPPQGLSSTTRDWSRQGVDVLAALFDYLNQTSQLLQKNINHAGQRSIAGQDIFRRRPSAATRRGENSTTTLLELNIVSPRVFLCAAQANNAFSAASELSTGYALYLEWQIGCEKFRRVWGPDDRVWLNSGVVGGIEDKSVILGARTVNDRHAPPIALYIPRQAGDAGGSVHEGSEGMRAILPSTAATKQQLLEGVLAVCRLFAAGVEPTVVEKLQRKFGGTWIRAISLPRCHLWEDPTATHKLSSEFAGSIDFEGHVAILIAHWHETFEQTFGAENFPLLQELQVAAVHWSNQDLAMFDHENVLSFCQSCAAILKKLCGRQDESRFVDQTVDDCTADINKLITQLFGAPHPIPPPTTSNVPLPSSSSTNPLSSSSSSSVDALSSSRSAPLTHNQSAVAKRHHLDDKSLDSGVLEVRRSLSRSLAAPFIFSGSKKTPPNTDNNK